MPMVKVGSKLLPNCSRACTKINRNKLQQTSSDVLRSHMVFCRMMKKDLTNCNELVLCMMMMKTFDELHY